MILLLKPFWPYSTSGANETIFAIKRSVRNSALLVENALVPIGSNLLFNNTAALIVKLNQLRHRDDECLLRVRNHNSIVNITFSRAHEGSIFPATLMMSPTLA